MSDGGDGFGEVFGRMLGARPKSIRTENAAHERCLADWWWESETKTAVIESANVIGLAMLPEKRFHPFELDTFGLGLVLKAIAERGARRCLVGIGGSATNDGGFGLARALGWRFLDRAGNPIESWTWLVDLDSVVRPKRRVQFKELTVATDVQNPLLGPRGATRIYGPQKGLSPGQIPNAESCLRRLARVVSREFGHDSARLAGSGAAGGLGFGLVTFAGARILPGFDLFAQQARLERRLRDAQLVITGEGRLDKSSLMGKGVGQIAYRCRQLGIMCIGLAGSVEPGQAVLKTFAEISALSSLTSSSEARSHPGIWLERLAHKVAMHWAE